MHFTINEDSNEELIWSLILNNLSSNLSTEASASTSSFYRTEDGIECSVRKRNGDLIANCYSESDRMGKRRWTIHLKWLHKTIDVYWVHQTEYLLMALSLKLVPVVNRIWSSLSFSVFNTIKENLLLFLHWKLW